MLVKLRQEQEELALLNLHHNVTFTQTMVQKLTELLNNANKFTAKGTITLEVIDGLKFVVSDTGSGISEADRKRIFTPFTKLDIFSEGVGLGLSFCEYTVRLLGGEITVDPDYAEGSRFIISFAQRVA